MIVMELAKGGELGEYLEKTGKMPEEKAKGAHGKFVRDVGDVGDLLFLLVLLDFCCWVGSADSFGFLWLPSFLWVASSCAETS